MLLAILLQLAAAPTSAEPPTGLPDLGPVPPVQVQRPASGPFGWPLDLSVHGNILARKERKSIFDENGDEVGDFARLRQLDIVLEGPVSEDVTLFAAPMVRSSLANDEFELDVDQAWLRFARLPVLGHLPGGTDVRIGQFRTDFGRLNRERVYDLPQPIRPRALTNFFGENGYAETGAATSTSLRIGGTGELRITGEYLDSGSRPLTDRDGGFAGGTNLRIAWVSDPDVAHGVELGASRLRSRQADRDSRRATVVGADVLYRWRPQPDRPARVWLGGEWLEGDIDREGTTAARPVGTYWWTRVRLDDRWSVGARFDLADELKSPELRTTTTALYVGYQQAEHLRFTVSVERSQSDVDLLDDVTRAFFEVDFAVGSRPSRPFWAR